ncbi:MULTISPECIES: hypothetical protein [Protofrankia]|uniref:DUF4190 domain-containing protein n=1 Tax=Candidatus Protofrankia datiscae TaxID=2716812 RepID=F8B3V4_9ACTN|nr:MULTISPECIES: hypothetical protein [Protofrankia]AEH09051.1 hypothetical protein FsymDg_1593 [Candidatus Protofrankia datiscae]
MRYGQTKTPGSTRTPTARRDSIISLVCGIIGLFFLGIILGIAAIAFGVRGRRGGGRLATAGLVLGVIDVALWIVGLTMSNANALIWY